MLGLRFVAYALLAYTAFWVAAYRGLWYDSHVFARKSAAFEFDVGDYSVSGRSCTGLVDCHCATAQASKLLYEYSLLFMQRAYYDCVS